MTLASGAQLGPYEILATLGAGGMGEVYRARDSRLDREVAIKVLPERFAQDATARTRFEREFKSVAQLSHPNIVTIYDFDTDHGCCYAVMELLQGETLGQRLRRSTLDWRTAVNIAIGVADGLDAAHSKGIVHRDIKPENVFLLTGGGLKILDFGLARLRAPALTPHPDLERTEIMNPGSAPTQGPATEPGMVLGTIFYMSPEQARGLAADARSDIFSFGCVLYEMVTGRRPFERATPADTMVAILHEAPQALSESGKERPVALDRVVARCLAKRSEDRFQTARELATALRAVLEETALTDTWKPQSLETLSDPKIQASPESQPREASLAVLPFVNMSADKDNEYFSDGLAEELIAVLSKVEGLHVASRTSAFAFKGKSEDVRRIGQQLNVRAVLEGSVRKSGNRLRISAQLVNVADGYHLWAETYDRTLEDVFAIQDEIAQNIAKALECLLTEDCRERAHTSDVQAYDYYLRGRQYFHEFRKKSFEFARQMFARAIEVDPAYARAYAGLADCHSFLYINWDKDPVHLREADAASRKALELAADLAEAHVSRGMALLNQGHFADARNAFQVALRRDPNLFEAHYFYARACLAEGEREEAARRFAEASRVRPEDYQALLVGGGVLAGLGRKADAEASYRRGVQAAERHLQLHPDDSRALCLGATGWTQLGQPDRAIDWANRALAIDPDEPMTVYNVACVYSLQNNLEKALDCLEQAVGLGYRHKAWIENDADLNPLRSHPRYQTLLQKM
jgi:serine/threonine protein kinase/Flp pilus assembly protein TadD